MDIDEYCAFCGTKLVHRNELVYDDSFLGISYPLKMKCDWCSKCGGYVFGSNIFERNRLRRNYRSRMIVKKYPFDNENWMCLDDACQIVNKSKIKFMRCFGDILFVLKRNGRWYVLKKSMEQFMEMCNCGDAAANGLFPIGE